jgi:RHS repeat-associated protein
MFLKRLMLVMIFFLFTFSYAEYEITSGNSSNKIGFNYRGCTSNVSGFFKTILSKLHYNNGKTYASVYNNSAIQFYYKYPSNDANDGYKVKFYVYDKNEKLKTSSNYYNLSDGGGIKPFVSSKDYDGEYFLKIKIQDKDDTSKYCVLTNKSNYIKIEQTSSSSTTLDNVDVQPNSATAGSEFTFKGFLSTSLPSGYKVKVDYGSGYKDMSCSGTTCIKRANPTDVGNNRNYNVKLYDNNANQIGHEGGTYTVTKAIVKLTINSLNKTTFNATDSTQDLRIYGSNFTNDTIVYIDYGSGWKSQSSSYTHLRNSGEIKFDLRTTKSGNGTWKVKVKNSDGYSNYKTFEVKKTITKPSTPTLKSPNNNSTLNGTTQILDWYSVTGATGYELALLNVTLNRWIYGVSKSTKKTTSSKATVSGLTEGHKYAWTVQAKNSAGLSNDSSVRYFTIKKSPTPITGSCGTANNYKYPVGSTSFGSRTQCNRGTPDNTNFSPLADNTIEWSCLGENGGNHEACMAEIDKAPDPINGECGSANTHVFLATDTGYGSRGQCKKGVANPLNFPSQGSTQNWSCNGRYNGTNANCSARREAKSDEPIKLNQLSTNPPSAKVNTEVIFKATLTENIPNELYRVYLNIDGQSFPHEMNCNGNTCTHPEIIKSAGTNRKFTCTLKKGNKVLSSKEGTYTMVDDFSVSEVLPKFLDTDNQNHTIVIKGSGFTKSSKIYRKQPNRSWTSVGTTFIGSSELRAVIIPTTERKGKWYFYVKNGSQKSNENNYILVKQNEAPILNISSTGTKEVEKGSSISLSLKAYDNDGDAKQIDVDWNDGSAVSSQTTSDNALKTFTHIYNNYGTYSWSSTAYDNEGKPSNRITGKVLVYDSQYEQTPSLSKIYSVNGNAFLSASGGQYLVLQGSNFSRLSSIEMIRPNGSRDVVPNTCTFGGGKKCIKYKSSTEIGVNLTFSAGDVGTWQFAVKNKDATSSYKTIEVKQINIRPYIIDMGTNAVVGKMVSGTSRTFSIKAYDGNDNLDKIYMIGNGATKIRDANSEESVSFSFTAPTVSSKKDITLTFQAKDKEGFYSSSVALNIAVYPSTVDNKSRINKEEIAKRSSCQEAGDSVEGAVSLATGAENFSLALLKVQGLHTIASIITYNSLLLTEGGLSKGWSHNYGVSANLEFRDENNIRVHWDDGRYNDFTKSGTKYTSTDLNSRFDVLEKTSKGYTLTKQNRMLFKFYMSGVIQEVSNYLNQKMLITFDDNAKLTSVEDLTSNLKLLYQYNGDGKLAKVVDPQLNREALFTYDDKGQLSSVESANGRYDFIYNDLGQMTEKTLEGTRIFKNTYHSDGRVSTEDDADTSDELVNYSFTEFTENGIKKVRTVYKNGLGNSKTFVYDAKDFLLYSMKDHYGNSWTNKYDPTSRALIESSNPKNQKSKYSYDTKGNLLSQTLPNGLVTNYSYDSNRNLLEEKIKLTDGTIFSTKYAYNINNSLKSKTLPNGDSTKYEYNSDNQIIKSLSPDNHATTYAYEKGRVSKVTYPKGNTITYVYDEAGRLITETIMPLNATTHYTYDEADRVTKVTDAMNHEVFVSYNQKGQKTSTTDAMGNVTSYRYDGNGNLIKTLYSDNTETTYAYDGEDRVKTISYANGATNKFDYDVLGRVTKQIDAMGNFVEFKYDVLGNVLQKLDTDGNLIVSYKYDIMQKVVEAVDYFNNKVSNTYNQLGMIEQTTDPLGRINKFKYDKLGRLTEAIDALNGISKQSYDKEGNTKDFTDPNINKTELKHDKVGNLTEIKTASNSTTKYEYDANGLLTKETNARGQERKYYYNKNAQVTSIVDEIGTVSYTYDDNGNTKTIKENSKTVSMDYNEMNQLTSYSDQEGNTLGYVYDAVGNLKTLSYPDGKKVEYAYNLANQLTEVKDWNNNVTAYAYDNHGRMVKQTYANGSVFTRVYDNGGRLISQKEFLSQFNRVSEYAYEYDKVGNILKERTYPQISPKALASLQMSYAKGNLLKEANQTVPTFDKDDNMLSFGSLALSYDSRNRLTKANGVNYVYDSQNNRLSKTVDGKKTGYLTNPNAPLSQVLLKTDADGGKTYYVYGLGLLSETKGSQTRYYHYDLRGSTIALSDKDGYITDKFTYAPYGKLLTHTGSHTTPFLFVGKHGVMQEENELVYMRARYYHESLRRFLNRDTLIGEVGDFGSLNRFGYVEGLVSGSIDPTGYAETGAMLGGILGGGAGIVISGGCDIGTAGACTIANPAIIVTTTTGGAIAGSLIEDGLIVLTKLCVNSIQSVVRSRSSTNNNTPKKPKLDCTKSIKEIYRLIKDLEKRYNSMQNDIQTIGTTTSNGHIKWSLFNDAYDKPKVGHERAGTWKGHQENFKNKQLALEREAFRAGENNCLSALLKALIKKWLEIKAPNTPL